MSDMDDRDEAALIVERPDACEREILKCLDERTKALCEHIDAAERAKRAKGRRVRTLLWVTFGLAALGVIAVELLMH